MKYIRVIGLIIWIIIATLILLTWFTSLEFNQDGTRIVFIFILTSGLPILFILSTKDKKIKYKLTICLFTIIVSTAIVLRLGTILFFGTGFKTQEILYIHKENKERRIEFQMEDLGAFGYNKRTVELKSFFLYLSWINVVNENEIDKTQWIFLGYYKNELELK